MTQIGGIIYLLSIAFVKRSLKKYKLKRFLVFTIVYFISTFLIVPYISPLFGRVKIENNHTINSHNFLTKFCNRNYVSKELHEVLTDVSIRFNKHYPNIKLVYLDANFPFFDGFPLLPHLSHNDGKKIDISFIYNEKKAKITNLKPSNSGYGVFIEPLSQEINQTTICKSIGYWQYDYPKYLTLGSNKDLILNQNATKKLIELISQNSTVDKIFIEPHLKQRFKLTSSKIRFHGCKAVRHDDHIHFQVK